MPDVDQIVDVAFNLLGRRQAIPKDHNYHLFSAISTIKSEIHGADWPIGIFPLIGVKKRPLLGDLLTTDRTQLRVRVPTDHLTVILGLIGHTLDIGGAHFRVMSPSVYPLHPSQSLDAMRVTFSLTNLQPDDGWSRAEELFLDSAKRHLESMGVTCKMIITGRQRLAVKGIQRMGWSLRCFEFQSEEQSLILQAVGLGGKRAFGCGLFRPTRVN